MQPYTRILNAGLVDVVQKRVPDFFCLRDETCANCRDADCTPGSQALGLWASFDGEPFLCLNRETYQHRTGALWDHAASFTNESKPLNVPHRAGACGTMLHHLRQRASHNTDARVCGTMLRRRSTPHYRSANHYIHPRNVISWEGAPCCDPCCCRSCCRCLTKTRVPRATRKNMKTRKKNHKDFLKGI